MALPRTGIAILAAALISLAAASCDAQSGSDGTGQRPASATASHRPQAVLPDGSLITLELAITPEEISQGLMFRPSLPEDRGMLFIFGMERVPSFWMKNTMIPLDLIFLDDDGTVVEIVGNAQPCAVEPCPHYIPSRPAAAVVEVAAGVTDRHGLAAGDAIDFVNVPGYPRAE